MHKTVYDLQAVCFIHMKIKSQPWVYSDYISYGTTLMGQTYLNALIVF